MFSKVVQTIVFHLNLIKKERVLIRLTCCDLQAVESCAAQAIPPLEIKVRSNSTECYKWEANSIQNDKRGRTIA